jgi:ectoine hydroxylase-related dioxygenase (phytanoyl-CoA dioxygenase family)
MLAAMLTAAEREAFGRDGWLVVRGVLDRARVAELERALDAIVPEASYLGRAAGRVVEIASISRGSSELRANAHDRRLAAIAGQALGAARLRLFQDTALIKPPHPGARVAWHRDFTYFAFLDRPAVVTMRVALTACTQQSGCMRVVSGSHHWAHSGPDLSFRADSVEDALSGLPPGLRKQAHERQTPIELEPGDVSLHHCLLLHSSGDNESARPRKTLAIRFVDDAVRVERARLPSPEVALLLPTDGDGRLADAAFPVLYEAGA